MTAQETHELKALQVQLAKLQAELKVLETERRILQGRYDQTNNNIRNLEKRLSDLQKNKEIVVSEHAFLRYFERVLGYNLTDIQYKLLNEYLCEQIGTLANGRFPISSPHSTKCFAVVKNYTIVTIE